MRAELTPNKRFPILRMMAHLSLGWLCISVANAAHAADFKIDRPKTRQFAPAFSLPDRSGKGVSLGHYSGKVVLVNFWATWCQPCREELPALQAIWQQYRHQGLVVLGIAADKEDQRIVSDYANRIGIDFPILFDPKGTVRNQYEVIGLPMSYLVGRDGKFSGRVIGFRDWESEGARTLIEDLLED